MQDRKWKKDNRVEYGLVDIATVTPENKQPFSTWYSDNDNNYLIVRGSYTGYYMLEYSNASAELIDRCRQLPGFGLEKHLMQYGQSMLLSEIRPILNGEAKDLSPGILSISCTWTANTQILKEYLEAIAKFNSLAEIINEIYTATGLSNSAALLSATAESSQFKNSNQLTLFKSKDASDDSQLQANAEVVGEQSVARQLH